MVRLIFLFALCLGCSVSHCCQPPNVGTVLYARSAVNRTDWTDRERLDLQYRKLADLLIPVRVPTDGEAFLKYLALIKKSANALNLYKRKRLLVVVSDAVGGYMQGVLLPNARKLYYEGQMTYSTAKKLHQFLDNIKYTLRTDGRGWMTPVEATVSCLQSAVVHDIKPFPANGDPCAALKTDADGNPIVRVPFFENKFNPKTLIMPFGQRPMVNLRDGDRYDQFYEYYLTTTRCIESRWNGTGRQLEYEFELRKWLNAEVAPLLRDPVEWYPVLWAASHVSESLNRRLPNSPWTKPYVPDRKRWPTRCDETLVPNANLYMAVILSSMLVCWTVAMLIVGNWHGAVCSFVGSMLCIRDGDGSSHDSIERQ